MKRFTWEDSLISNEVSGRLSNGAVNVALRLAKVINWTPKGGRPSGLYWKNEDACKEVGVGRSTFYKYMPELRAAGFFQLVNNNYIPTLPESTVETMESTVETMESTLWTGKSTGRNPFSEDIYSEDTFSEDSLSEVQPALQAGTNTPAQEGVSEGPTFLGSNTSLLPDSDIDTRSRSEHSDIDIWSELNDGMKEVFDGCLGKFLKRQMAVAA